jgi:hypothetical protein
MRNYIVLTEDIGVQAVRTAYLKNQPLSADRCAKTTLQAAVQLIAGGNPMVTQVREPAALDLKTLPVTVSPVPHVTQKPRVDNSSPIYRPMAEKDSAEVGAYLRATAGLGNA